MPTFPTPVPLVAASLMLGLAVELRAEPVDPFDPMPRSVQVEIEVSPHPADVGLVWSAPLPGSFSYIGDFGPDHAQITVPGAVYEDFLQTYGLPAGFTVIPGTVTDFIILISRTSLDIHSGVGCDVDVGFGPKGRLGRALDTIGPDGFFQFSGTGPYYHCLGPLPFGTCFPVYASLYDPPTGLVNAPGTDRITHPDGQEVFPFYAWHGEMRLSEVAPAVPALPVAWWIALAAALVLVGLAATATPRLALRARGAARARPGSRR